MADAKKNFATSVVATAPSPAASGTSLVVAAGEGARFATPPFNAVICPSDAEPTPANAEVVRVTGIATDTFTITRATESSTARTVIVGDSIYAGATKKTFDDIEALEEYVGFPNWPPAFRATKYYSPTIQGGYDAGGAYTANRLVATPFWVPHTQTFVRIGAGITALQASQTVRLGIYADDPAAPGIPGALVLDAGTIDAGSTGWKEITISQSLTGPALYWLALVSSHGSVSVRRCLGWNLNLGSANLGAHNGAHINDYAGGALPNPFAPETSDTALAPPYIVLRT